MAAIEVEALRRTYRQTSGFPRRRTKTIEAVRGIDFEVSEGELFGLLGPNGAGKTTTIKMLVTLLIPTSGTARVRGLDVVRDARGVRRKSGYVFGGEVGARELRHTVAELARSGKSVLLTTHYMYEADALCNRIAVIAHGEIVATGTPSDLKSIVADRTVVEIEAFGAPEETIRRLREAPGVTSVAVEDREQAQVL